MAAGAERGSSAAAGVERATPAPAAGPTPTSAAAPDIAATRPPASKRITFAGHIHERVPSAGGSREEVAGYEHFIGGRG